MASDLHFKNVLILEDDFTFIADTQKVVSSLDHFFNSVTEWDAVLLTRNSGTRASYDSIIEVCLGSGNAAGYLVNQHLFERLSNTIEESIGPLRNTHIHWVYAIDVVWRQYMSSDKWFNFVEPLGYQKPGYSDISNSFVNNT